MNPSSLISFLIFLKQSKHLNFLQIFPPAFSKLNCQIQSKVMSSFGLSFDHHALKRHSWCICFHQKGFVQFLRNISARFRDPDDANSISLLCPVTCSDTVHGGNCAQCLQPAPIAPYSQITVAHLPSRYSPPFWPAQAKLSEVSCFDAGVLKLIKDPSCSEKQQVLQSVLMIP